MVVTAGDACAYVADQRGFVHVYDIEEYSLQGQELQPSTSRHELSTWDVMMSIASVLVKY